MRSDRAREHDNRRRVYTVTRAVTNRARMRALERLRLAHPAEFDVLYQQEIVKAREEIAESETANLTVRAPRSATSVNAKAIIRRPAAQKPPTVLIPNPTAPAVLLKPGPPPAQATVADRIRTDVGGCAACIGRHDADHVCPVCGSRPQLAVVQKRSRPGWSATLERDLKAARS